MMSPEEVIRALLLNGSPTAMACVDSIRAGTQSALFPPLGQFTAREAITLYEHRHGTALRGGIVVEGMETFLHELSMRGDGDIITLAPFSGTREVYSVFLDDDGKVVGCVRVERRATDDDRGV